jgi:hypothetical protein
MKINIKILRRIGIAAFIAFFIVSIISMNTMFSDQKKIASFTLGKVPAEMILLAGIAFGCFLIIMIVHIRRFYNSKYLKDDEEE